HILTFLALALEKGDEPSERIAGMMDRDAVYRLNNKSEFERRDAIEAMASKARADARGLTNPRTVVVETGGSNLAYSFETKGFPLFDRDIVDLGFGQGGATDIVYHLTVSPSIQWYHPSSEAEARKIEGERAASNAIQRTYLQLTRAHDPEKKSWSAVN